eukprot:10573915-Ditylum_brightwellii.AAC.1
MLSETFGPFTMQMINSPLPPQHTQPQSIYFRCASTSEGIQLNMSPNNMGAWEDDHPWGCHLMPIC